MSKHQAIKTIRSELSKLNQDIDLKIIRGVPYAREARRHKFLISELRRLNKTPFGLLGRSLSFVSTFVF